MTINVSDDVSMDYLFDSITAQVADSGSEDGNSVDEGEQSTLSEESLDSSGVETEGDPKASTEEAKGDTASAPQAPVVKKWDGKVHSVELPDGSKTEIPADAKVSYKMNGQTIVAPLQDVLNKVSGVDNIDREYSKLKREKDAFYHHVNKFKDEVEKGNAIGAVIDSVAQTGKDPVVFLRALKTQFLNFAQHYATLSPEQRQILDAQEENNYYKKRAENEAALRQRDTKYREFEVQKAQIEQKFSMPSGAFEETLSNLQALQREGRLPKGEFGVEEVALTYQGLIEQETASARLSQVDEIAKQIDPSLVQDEEMREVIEIALKDNLPHAEIVRILREQYGKEAPTPKPPVTDRAASEDTNSIAPPKPATKAEQEKKTRSHRQFMEEFDSL